MSVSRVRFKDSAIIRPSHGLPHIWKMIEAAAKTSPKMRKDEIVITEGWRLPRHPDDAHTWCSALDLRIHNIDLPDPEARIAEGWAWIKRMRAVLDDSRYQFDLHGVSGNVHIHMEFDPR